VNHLALHPTASVNRGIRGLQPKYIHMIIHIYSLCWNKERILPYFFLRYNSLADCFFIFDDTSTDSSLKMLAKYPKNKNDRFYKQPDSLVANAAMFNDNLWKRSHNKVSRHL